MTMISERAQSAAEDFDDDFVEEMQKEADKEWLKKLTVSKQGVEKTVHNAVLILQNDPKLSGIRFDVLANSVEIQDGKPVPWRKDCGKWTNSDDDQLYIYLGRRYAEFPQRTIDASLTSVSHARSFHPIKEYFESLPEWDGTKRAEFLFIDYLGADDNVYVREATALWLRAAIARIYIPGCKFDYVPVISGPAGIGKSTMMSKIGVKWFSDSLTFEDMKDKTAAEKLQGVWIHEISELKGMRKMDVETIKAFISRQNDLYRPAYGKRAEEHPRSCVFIGTSNDGNYLKDVTGNRRFWPITVTGAGLMSPWDLTDDDVNQIWAEVYATFKEIGRKNLYLGKEATKLAVAAQEAALETDEREGLVSAYLDVLLPEDWNDRSIPDRKAFFDEFNGECQEAGSVERDGISIAEILASDTSPADPVE